MSRKLISQALLTPSCGCAGVAIAAGERVLVEVSRKFTPRKLAGLAYNSGLYTQVLASTLA